MVMRNRKCGFINELGEIVIPLIYETAADFSDGMASVKLGNTYYFLDTEGLEKLSLSLDLNSVPERIIVKVNQSEQLYINGKLVSASIKKI